MFKSLGVRAIFSLRFQRLTGEVFWIGLGQALAVLGGMVGVRLLTQVLTPTRFGELALGLTLVGLVTQLAFGPFQQGVLRFFGPAQELNELRAYLAGVKRLLVRATLFIVGIAGLALLGLWVFGQAAWIGLVAVALILALISSYERILDAMQSAARQRTVTAWHQALGQWLRFSLAVALMAWLGASSHIAILGYLLATIIVLISQFMFFRHKFGAVVASQPQAALSEVRKWDQRVQHYAWPFIAWGSFTWLQQSSDRWALQVFSQTRDVGYYTVLTQLSYMPIILLTGVMVQFLQPILFSRAGDGTDKLRVKYARQLNQQVIIGFIVLTLLGTGLAAVLHGRIFALFVAPEYRIVSSFMPWMVLSGGLFASSEVTVLLFTSNMNIQILIAPKIVLALLGFLLNFAGAFWLGLSGVVLASVSFSFVSLIVMLVLSKYVHQVGVNQVHALSTSS